MVDDPNGLIDIADTAEGLVHSNESFYYHVP